MSQIPAQFVQFIDDAAVFPPGNVPLDRAVSEHREHRGSQYADLIGGFVISDARLPELTELIGEAGEQPVAINLVVSGGVGAIEGAVKWASRSPAVRLEVVEFALRDEDDLSRNAQRAIAMLDTLEEELDGATTYVEMPRLDGEPSHSWQAAVEQLAAREIPLKFRTGWLDPVSAPTPEELAACIDTALDNELPFKCTAGLHHAIAHEGAHGFLNVLAATVASLEGGDVAGALRETDPAALSAVARAEGERGRRWFRSFGCCAVLEPHEDLVDLGLIDS